MPRDAKGNSQPSQCEPGAPFTPTQSGRNTVIVLLVRHGYRAGACPLTSAAMSRYARRLDRDLARWREQGWISPDGEAAIRRDVASRSRGLELAPVLGILGAVLIGFGAMSFVAAHWNEMPRLLRLSLIFGGLFGAYGLAGFLFDRKHPAFAHAAILVGVSLFGAGIMLIAQMFHISGHAPDAVLTWALGALLAGLVLRSNPALALAMLLVGLWGLWEMYDSNHVYWPFLVGWAAVA